MPIPASSSPGRIVEAPGSGTAPECAALTDRGRRRTVNQDRWLVVTNDPRIDLPEGDDGFAVFADRAGPRFLVAAVADGMGGHQGGEIAATAAIERLGRDFTDDPSALRGLDPSDGVAMESLVRRLMEECRDAVVERASRTPGAGNMATTLTFAIVLGDEMFLGHAGDCRSHVLRGRRIEQLTTDHTAAEKVRSGADLGIDLPPGSPLDHLVVNALGAGTPVDTEFHRRRIGPGETVLLCSDGIARHLGLRDIVRIAGGNRDPAGLCAALVGAANGAGGTDNITCVALRFPEIPAGPLARLRERWRRRHDHPHPDPDAGRQPLLALPAALVPGGEMPWPLVAAFALLAFSLAILVRTAFRATRPRGAGANPEPAPLPAETAAEPAGDGIPEARSDPEARAIERIAEIKDQFLGLEPLLRVPAVRDNPHVQRRLDVFHARLHAATKCLEEMRGFSSDLWSGLEHDLTQTFENLREALTESVQEANGRQQGLATEA